MSLGKLVLEKKATVNKEKYLEHLCDSLKDCFDRCQSKVSMQNSAPAYLAKLIKEWLEFCRVDCIEDWPGNSLNLNLIENLFVILKRHLMGQDTSPVPREAHHLQ